MGFVINGKSVDEVEASRIWAQSLTAAELIEAESTLWAHMPKDNDGEKFCLVGDPVVVAALGVEVERRGGWDVIYRQRDSGVLTGRDLAPHW